MRKKADERAGFAAAYREGLGLAAIAILKNGEGTRIIAPPSGEDGALSAAESLQACWWCRRADDAAHIAAAAARMLRREANDGGTAAAAHTAAAAVVAAAKKRGIALYSERDIADEAMKIAARVDAELQQQHACGALKSVNKAYRDYRLQTSGRGERVLRYDEWMRQYREKLVRQIASALRQI